MDADRPLKTLFRLRSADLLPWLGEAGAAILSTRVVELTAVKRQVDCVMRLRRGRAVYLRHVEFQMCWRRDLALRLFDYAARLVAQYRRPVVTTVIFVRRPAPRDLTHRETIGGRLVHERRFDVIRLWEEDPRRLMRLGVGGAALVGAVSRRSLATVGRAAKRILERAPAGQRADLLAILQGLSEGRYTARQLARVIPEEVVMGSSLFAKVQRLARSEGRAQGLAQGEARGLAKGEMKGELLAVRRLCRELVARHHPGAAASLSASIARCADVSKLRAWTLAAPEVSSDELRRRVLGRRASVRTVVHVGRRAPRPARRAKSR